MPNIKWYQREIPPTATPASLRVRIAKIRPFLTKLRSGYEMKTLAETSCYLLERSLDNLERLEKDFTKMR
jgi:hypothetical protein